MARHSIAMWRKKESSSSSDAVSAIYCKLFHFLTETGKLSSNKRPFCRSMDIYYEMYSISCNRNFPWRIILFATYVSKEVMAWWILLCAIIRPFVYKSRSTAKYYSTVYRATLFHRSAWGKVLIRIRVCIYITFASPDAKEEEKIRYMRWDERELCNSILLCSLSSLSLYLTIWMNVT